MKDRVADLHRRSTKLPDKARLDPEPLSRKGRSGWFSRVPWGFLSFLLFAMFGVWRFVPPGYLPRSMTYASVMGRLEGSIQGEAAAASMNQVAASKAAEAKATAPVAVQQAVDTATQIAPVETAKATAIAAAQAKIDQVRSCRQSQMQAAGGAYAQCVSAGNEPGAVCDAQREMMLERISYCGVLPGEPVDNTADPAAGGETE